MGLREISEIAKEAISIKVSTQVLCEKRRNKPPLVDDAGSGTLFSDGAVSPCAAQRLVCAVRPFLLCAVLSFALVRFERNSQGVR